MKNTIKYYYNLEVDDIFYDKGRYYFLDYVFIPYYKDLDINLYNTILMNNYYVHSIIYNKDNSYITNFENKPFILFKISKNISIDLDVINSFNIPIKMEKKIGWDVLWENKIDYYEKNILSINNKKLKESFNYFVGMTENAILLYKSLKLTDDYYVCHMRLNDDVDFYNPLNLIIDYKARDIVEYIKKMFFEDRNYNDYLKKYIYYSNYNDVMLLFIRFLYPTFYFDCLDAYLLGDEYDLSYYEKIMAYERFLKYIYMLIRQKYQVPKIEWLS